MRTKKSTILDIADFHARVVEGKRPRGAVRLAQPGAPAASATAERVVSFVFSDASIDRYGDTIDARGWVLDSFAVNPVALFGHDAGSVENVIGKARNVRVQGQQLIGEIEFAEASVNPNAEIVYQMVKGGYLSTVSVGFQPIEWTLSKDKSRPGGIDFNKQELLEISIVPIPANPNAVALAKAAGIEVDRLKLFEAPVTATVSVTKKGLYAVSQLAQLLAELGWLEESVEWEAEYEGDGSAVPQMLTDALKQLGAALVAMTVEEVNELLAEEDGAEPNILIEDVVELAGLTPAQRAFVAIARASRTTAGKAHLSSHVFSAEEIEGLRALVTPGIKAGKTLSAASKKSISDAHDMIVQGCEALKALVADGEEISADETEARARRAREAEALELGAG